MRKIFQRALTALLVVAGLISASVANAEVKTVTGEGSYVMSNFENAEVAKERAKVDAISNVCEKAVAFVKSFSRSNEFDQDIIETLASEILKDVDVQFHNEKSKNNTTLIRATITAQINSDDMYVWMNTKKPIEIELLVSQYEFFRKANAKLFNQNEELKSQFAQATNKAEKKRIRQELDDGDKKFLSNLKVNEGWIILANKKYGPGGWIRTPETYEAAKNYFEQAIDFNPDNANAWLGRGRAYKYLRQDEQAVQDYNKAIELNPNLAEAYLERVEYYGEQNLKEQVIKDCNKAIQLNPNYAGAYFKRGWAYRQLNQIERAIQDYNKAIELYPNYTDAYAFRSSCYKDLGDEEKANADLWKARRLGWKG